MNTPKPALLIVDDDPDQLGLFRIAAERSGEFSRIATAEDADAAVDEVYRLIDTLPHAVPKIVLTDLRMPGTDGFDLIHRLRHTSDVLPISLIAMSSSAYKPAIDAALEAGCCAFFQKPSDFVRLKALVASLPHLCNGEMPDEARVYHEENSYAEWR